MKSQKPTSTTLSPNDDEAAATMRKRLTLSTMAPTPTAEKPPTLYRRLHAALNAAMQQRKDRAAVVDGEIGWIAYERAVMFEMVNRIRADEGRWPLEIDEIKAAERAATGHIDYASKWARYCADLVRKDVPGTNAIGLQALRLLRMLIGSINHDINNTISMIHGDIYLLRRLQKALDESKTDAERLDAYQRYVADNVRGLDAVRNKLTTIEGKLHAASITTTR